MPVLLLNLEDPTTSAGESSTEPDSVFNKTVLLLNMENIQ